MNAIDKNEYNLKEIIDNKNFLNLKKKVEIKKTDMSDDLQSRCIEKIVNSVEKFLTDGGVADSNLDVILTFN